MAGIKGEKASGDVVFGPEPWTVWFKDHSKLIIICLCIVAAGVLFWYFKPQGHGDDSSNETAQKTLVTSLDAAITESNDQQIINITSQLINGSNKGTYNVDDSTLAKYYVERSTSNINTKQYGKVQADSEAAVKLSSKTKSVAYYFEFEARYKLGERQSTVPLLNKLIKVEQSSSNPMKGSAVAQYQQDISDIQHNVELSIL